MSFGKRLRQNITSDTDICPRIELGSNCCFGMIPYEGT